jgi:hypothetical protein
MACSHSASVGRRLPVRARHAPPLPLAHAFGGHHAEPELLSGGDVARLLDEALEVADGDQRAVELEGGDGQPGGDEDQSP